VAQYGICRPMYTDHTPNWIDEKGKTSREGTKGKKNERDWKLAGEER